MQLSDLVWNLVFVVAILLLAEGETAALLVGLTVLAFFDLVALGVRTGYVGYEGGGVCLYWPRLER